MVFPSEKEAAATDYSGVLDSCPVLPRLVLPERFGFGLHGHPRLVLPERFGFGLHGHPRLVLPEPGRLKAISRGSRPKADTPGYERMNHDPAGVAEPLCTLSRFSKARHQARLFRPVLQLANSVDNSAAPTSSAAVIIPCVA